MPAIGAKTLRTNASALVRRRARGGEPLAAAARDLRRERRATDCVELLARCEERAGADGRLDLSARARARLAELAPQVANKSLTVAVTGSPSVARGDPLLLARAVDELLDNALAHNVPGGWLEVTTETLADRAIVRVANGGRRIAAPANRIRAEGADARGLGLTLVRAIVSSHRGNLWISAPPSGGFAVELELPGETPMPAPR